MDRHSDVVQNENGRAVAGASVRVLDAQGQLATLFADRAGLTRQQNPIPTDALGRFSFCAADGLYSAEVYLGRILKGVLPEIRLEDPSDGITVLAQPQGASLIGAEQGSTVQDALDGLRVDVDAWEPYELPVASSTTLGGVKAGSGVTIDAQGVLTIPPNPYTLPPATNSVLGGVKIGSGITVGVDGTISVSVYSLPVASASTLGGIKVGTGLVIDGSGTLNATGTTTGSVASVNSTLPDGSGNVALNTDTIQESGTPTNQWFTAARVRSVVLTGLSTATNAAITAADTILAAFGKLQAQITANVAALGTKQDASAKDATGGYAGLTGFAINIKNAAGTITSTIASAATAARAYVFPDKAGTVVLDSTVGEAGLRFFDSGTTNTLDYRNGNVQRWAPASGAKALSITNWPASGRYGIVQVEGVNLAAGAIPTWPSGTVFVKPDDTEVATFAELGVTLKTSGTDRILLWTRNGGTTVYLKVR